MKVAANCRTFALVASNLGATAFLPAASTPSLTADPAADEVIELSPFEVHASKNDARYYAENTLAGSRLNSNLGDLGASISIVTKQQLTDTAARDLNDVLLYEANTEGTGNYIAFAFDGRGSVSDHVAGIQPGGIVNQSTARASVHRSTAEISLRADTEGGWRASLAVNQPLKREHLGIYFAAHLVRSRLGLPSSATAPEADVAKIMQLPDGWREKRSLGATATSSIDAQGLEFQLVYNPAENWTLKITGGRQEAIFSRVAPEWDEWVALRMPVWLNAVDDRGVPFWTATHQPRAGANDPPVLAGLTLGNTPAAQRAVGVEPLMRLARANQGKVTPTEREWRWNLLTNYQFTHEPWQGLSLGGAVRWEDKAAIGYYGAPADPDGDVRNLDADRPIYDDALAHLDLWIAYVTRAPRWLGEETRIKMQLNVRAAGEKQQLQPVSANRGRRAERFSHHRWAARDPHVHLQLLNGC